MKKKTAQTTQSKGPKPNPWGHYRAAQPVGKLDKCVVPAGLSDNTTEAVFLDFDILESAVYQMQSYVGQMKGKVSPKELLRQFRKQCPQELYYTEPYMQTIIEDYNAPRRARPGMIAKAMIQDARGLKKSTVETYIKRARAKKQTEHGTEEGTDSEA